MNEEKPLMGTDSTDHPAEEKEPQEKREPAVTNGVEEEPNETQAQENQDDFTWGEGLSLQVSADEMHASVEVAASMAEKYSSQDILRLLEENKITFGIDPGAIQNIFNKHYFNRDVNVANGISVINGEDGRIEWDVDLSILEGARVSEKGGRVDWKEVHHILPVKKNQVIARMIDPTDGTPGRTVYDKEIPPAKGKPVKFPAGKGLRASEDGKKLLANLDGVVCREGEKISVSEVLNIQGDVSLATGNIRCETTVTVSGGVMTDFIVEADQDIHVNGLVEGAFLTAGGNIYINGGVQGGEKALIKAQGDVTVKFINNAKIEAGGNVIVHGAITNSTVKSKGSILLDTSRAHILGGHVMAEHEISAAVIGSELGVKSIVELGHELSKLLEKKQDETQKMQPLVENYEKIRKAVDSLNKLNAAGKLQPQQAELRLKLIRTGMQLQGQIKRIEESIQQTNAIVEKARKNQKGITAREILWPGTVIRIMGQNFPIRNRSSKAVVALVGKSVELFAYKGDK